MRIRDKLACTIRERKVQENRTDIDRFSDSDDMPMLIQQRRPDHAAGSWGGLKIRRIEF